MMEEKVDIHDHARLIFQAGVEAADPAKAVKNAMQWSEGLQFFLDPDDHSNCRTGNWKKIHLIAFGKAALKMIQAALSIIPENYLAGKPLAVTNYENVQQSDQIEIFGASHPVPDQAGFDAGKIIVQRLNQTREGELVLVLVSGGGSALVPYPRQGISLQDKQQITQALLESGATINQVNCVRKHLSSLKGGQLAQYAVPADLQTLIISDVIGDDLSAIASGPTVPDNTTFADAVNVLQEKQLWQNLPESAKRLFEQGVDGQIAETPDESHTCFKNAMNALIASNALSLHAVEKKSQAYGYDTVIMSESLTGEARQAAEDFVGFAKQLICKGKSKPYAILAGGETTVLVKGSGLGGRNQEMALAFVEAAHRCELQGEWVFLSGGTDGRDGPTDAAGAIVDRESIDRIHQAGIDIIENLDNNDSYNALKQSQDLLITGATGTNVADLQILLIQ